MPTTPPTPREGCADPHTLRTLSASILGNVRLAREAIVLGATDRPIAAWLRTAEADLQRIAALHEQLLTRCQELR